MNQISAELNIPQNCIQAVINLLNEGNTVPFVARYRKEATGNLDEVQIRNIQERHQYLTELEDRRQTILKSVEGQGKLTDDLKDQITNAATKNQLEDLYLPYKPKRRTRAAIAREKGLEPLAKLIMEQSLDNHETHDEEALAGARDIVSEWVSENLEIRTFIREFFDKYGVVVSKVIEGKDKTSTKFEQYYNFNEKVSTIPSHRYLAIRRGEKEEILDFHIAVDPEPIFAEMTRLLKVNKKSPFSSHLELAILDSYKRLLSPSIETDLKVDLKMKSDRAAVDIFAQNLRNLLMASPLGTQAVIGIDPGLRTGCKCAAVDQTGKFLNTFTFNLVQGDRSIEEAKKNLLAFIKKYHPYAIGIGNGTAGRETEAFVRSLLNSENLNIIVVSVSESGASVYSASDIAREEFPDLDLTIRGAISIARRLQDPLSELVKVDPKAIGVGQYQHDVYPQLLQDKLVEVVESCVNQVGVEINTASAPLLSHVSGIGPSLALKLVSHRESHGLFQSRKDLLKIPGLGPKTFEQAAGFLRIRQSQNPLDSSAVHPERYQTVEKMARDLDVPLQSLIGNDALISKINIKKYLQDDLGELTLKDIIDELKKPGRDPRATFEKMSFRDDVNSISDLKQGMKLDGIITNVTAFGAFVDIGVHQDGLIHLSELTDRFIQNASEVVSVGDKVKVEVLSIDLDRKRISLTARAARDARTAGNARTNSKPPKQFNSNPFSTLKGIPSP